MLNVLHAMVADWKPEDVIERTVPHFITICANYFRELYEKRFIVSSHEWPFTTHCISEKEEVVPSVFVIKQKGKHDISNTNDKLERALAFSDGIVLYDVLKTEFSDSTQALKMLIDGASGMGKTTLVQTVCVKWSKDQLLQHFKLVILISLREMKVECMEDLFQCGAIDDHDLLQRLVDYIMKTRGREILFIFDGFDELSPEERRKDSLCLKIIKGEKLTECSVIVTSRPHASEYLVEQKGLISSHIEILGFNREQVCSCINNSVLAANTAKELTDKLQERPNILSLCYIPLNCAIVISTYAQSNSNFPTTQTELFQHFILGMLKRHAICVLKSEILVKELRCYQIDSKLPKDFEQCLNALGKLAYSGMCKNKLIFTYKEIKSSFPEDHERHRSQSTIETFCLGLLTSIVPSSSVVDEARKYQFLHSTIQEYLAARYCSQLENLDLLQRHVYSSQFALFYAGLTKLKGSMLENLLFFERVDINTYSRKFLTYCHFVFESQRLCLFQTLFDNLFNKDILNFAHEKLSDMDCVVISHFLCYTEHTWKELNLNGCYLSDQSLDTFVQVCHSNLKHNSGPEYTATFQTVCLSKNQPSFAAKVHQFPWLSNTKYLKMHCDVHSPQFPNSDTLMNIDKLDVKLLNESQTIYQMFVDSDTIILHSVDLDDISDFNLRCTKTLTLIRANRSLTMSTLSFFQKHSQKVEVKSITLNDCNINIWTNNCICSIVSIKTLRELRLIHVEITGYVASSLFEVLINNKSLEILDLSRNPISVNDANKSYSLKLKEMISSNTTLKNLRLLQTEIDDNIVCDISSGICFNSTLEVLDLNENNQIGAQTALNLIQTIHRSGLKSLHILGVEISYRIHCWHFKAKKSPHKIDLFCALCTSIYNGNVESIAGALLISITTLDLQSLDMTPRQAKDLFRSIEQNVHLKVLNLSHNNSIGNSGKISSALESMLLNNTSVQTLKMEYCDLMDSFCTHISIGLSKNNSLKELHLCGNKICNNGACKIFESLTDNECLEIFDMSSNVIQFWNIDFLMSMQKLMSSNAIVNLLSLARFSSLKFNSNKSIEGRVIEVCIDPVPQSVSNFNRLFQSFFNAASMSGFHIITDNTCSLHNKFSSWHMKCHCYRNHLYTNHCLKFICSVNANNFHSVDLSRTNVSSNTAVLIFQSLLREDCFIKDLDLSNNNISCEPKQVSKAFKTMLEGGKCCLQMLCLSNCSITDEVCANIAAGLRQNHTLTKLDLSKNLITASGAGVLFQSLNFNSALENLSLADNHNIIIIAASEDVKSAVQSLFSANMALKYLNLFNAINDDIIESLAKGLMVNDCTKLTTLHFDINLLSASALLCLLEAMSKHTQVHIQGSRHCFSFEQMIDSQWHLKCTDKVCMTKLYCAMHSFSNFELSLKSVQVLDLKNVNINTNLAVWLLRSLQGNKWLKELDLSRSSPYNGLASSNDSKPVGKALKQMLIMNESLLCLNLCNAVNEDIACGLIGGLKENKTLQVLHIDISSLHHRLIAELLQPLSSNSKLLHIKIESVGIFHAHILTENKISERWCEVQHAFQAFHALFLVQNIADIYHYLQNMKVPHVHNLHPVQFDNGWCMHLKEGGFMLPKFCMALSEAVRDHQCPKMILDMWRSIKKVRFQGASDIVEAFIKSLVTCPYHNIEHIDISSDVVNNEMGDSLKTLLTYHKILTILSIHTPIGDEAALRISEGLTSTNLRKLDINVQYLSITSTVKIIQCTESSEVQELKMTPLLVFQQQQAKGHSWCMKLIKSTSLQYVHRLYDYIQQEAIVLKHGILKTLELSSSYHVSIPDTLKSFEKHSYPFLEAIKVIIVTESEDEHHRICTALNNVLSSRQCHLKVLRIVWISGSLINQIMFGLKINSSLTVLDLECDSVIKDEVTQLIKNSSALTKLRLSCNAMSLSNTTDMKDAFKQLLTNNKNLKDLEFCVDFKCDEIIAEICVALSSLERLCVSPYTVTEKGIASLLNLINSDTHCPLNAIELKGMCMLKRSSHLSKSWHLEVNLACPRDYDCLDHLFQCLNSTSNLQIDNPIKLSHSKGSVRLPLYAFGNQLLSRWFEFQNISSPINLLLCQSQFVEVTNATVTAIKVTLSKLKLGTLKIYSPNNIPFIEQVLSYVADEQSPLSLSVLQLTVDIFALSNTAILNLVTLLVNSRVSEVALECDSLLRLKRKSDSSILFDIDSTDSVNFCKLFCILNENHSNPNVSSILTCIKKLDLSKIYVEKRVCSRLLDSISSNTVLEDLSLPRIREREINTSDISIAIGRTLAANNSLTVLRVHECHAAIASKLAEGLSNNTTLKCLHVHPMIVQQSDSTLLRSILSHGWLSYLHTTNGYTHLRRDTEHWQLDVGKNSDDKQLIILFFCSLTKIYQDDCCESYIKKKALSILQSISTIELRFQDLIFGWLTKEFEKSIAVSSMVKFVDMYDCQMSDIQLQTMKAITRCDSLEQLYLHLVPSTEHPSFDGICDALRKSISLKDVTIFLSSLIFDELSVVILEFNKCCALPCGITIKFSDVSIFRNKEDASWDVDLSSAGNKIQYDTCGCFFRALRSVQRRSALNLSFCFSESLQSLNLAMVDMSSQLVILQSVVGKSTLKHLDLTGSNLFADDSVGAEIIHGLLSHPSRLERLNMALCSLDNSMCGNIAERLKSNTSLKALKLTCTRIQGEGALKIFQAFNGNSTLEVLDLSDNKELTSGDNEKLAEAIHAMLQTENSSLKFISLRCCNVTDEVCNGIASGLSRNTSLKKLDLQRNIFTDKSIVKMLKNCNNLEELNLSMNKQLMSTGAIDDLGNAFEQMIKTSTCLRRLKLSGSVNDIVVNRILSGMKFKIDKKNLMRLDVDECPLNAKTVADLVTTCEYEGFELFVANKKCTYTSKYWDEAYRWQIENNYYSSCKSDILFYLLIFSADLHGRPTTIGQRAYGKLHSVTYLDLSDCNLSSSQFLSIVESLFSIPKLVKLNLSVNKHLIETSEAVCRALNNVLLQKRIKALNISCTGIQPQSWKHLFSGLHSSVSSLEVLDISGNNVGQEGSAALIQMLSTFSGPMKLNISDCIIPDEFFNNVLRLATATELKLNCDQHQRDLLKSSNATLDDFEVSCINHLMWWHQKSTF